jgi:hypothetical protein
MLQKFINRYAIYWFRDDEDEDSTNTLFFGLVFLNGLLDISKGDGSYHIWVGPAGLHLFWPLWQSRPGWCRQWRRELA